MLARIDGKKLSDIRAMMKNIFKLAGLLYARSCRACYELAVILRIS